MTDRDNFYGYFSFSRKERIGILVIVGSIVIIGILPGFMFRTRAVTVNLSPADSAVLKELQIEQSEVADGSEPRNSFKSTPYRNVEEKSDFELFAFDPNTLDESGWKRLGLRDKTIKTILNYRSKGGRFRKREDLQRVYGLRDEEYHRLQPYISIVSEDKGKGESSKFKEYKDQWYTSTYFKKSPQIIDINLADTAAWIALPGIGSKLANRIVVFRDKLGGFYSVQQVKETYGLQDSTFQKILPYLKASPNSIRKININTALPDELKAHPYIRWQIAQAIVNYRNQHGAFKRVEELRNVMMITDEVYLKLQPYISIE